VIAAGLEKATSADAPGLEKATSAADAPTSSEGEAALPWRPVWLRRAQARNEPAAASPRPRRKGATRAQVDASAASETSGADST